VWCPGQHIRITPLSFFHGCRKRRLKDWWHLHLWWTAIRRRWAYHLSRRNIWDASAAPSGIKHEWYVCMYIDPLSRTRTSLKSAYFLHWTFYRSCFKGIRANIERQVYSVTCYWPYMLLGCGIPFLIVLGAVALCNPLGHEHEFVYLLGCNFHFLCLCLRSIIYFDQGFICLLFLVYIYCLFYLFLVIFFVHFLFHSEFFGRYCYLAIRLPMLYTRIFFPICFIVYTTCLVPYLAETYPC
jgi:hypothetical protein